MRTRTAVTTAATSVLVLLVPLMLAWSTSDATSPAQAAPAPTAAASDDGPSVMLGRILDATVCTEDDGTLVAGIDAPEAETAYVIDPGEPVTMTIFGEGYTDVSDSVTVDAGEGGSVYTASFVTDTDGFGLDEVRLEAPSVPDACG